MGPDFADRLADEGCPRVGWKTQRNLRYAGVQTEADWLAGQWRYHSRGIGPGLERIINEHIGKTAAVPHRDDVVRPTVDFPMYVAAPAGTGRGTPLPPFHYTGYWMVRKHWWTRGPVQRHEALFVSALCGQTPTGAQYSDAPPDRPLCGLCSRMIDAETAKH
jgi:hypothetical protein